MDVGICTLQNGPEGSFQPVDTETASGRARIPTQSDCRSQSLLRRHQSAATKDVTFSEISVLTRKHLTEGKAGEAASRQSNVLWRPRRDTPQADQNL